MVFNPELINGRHSGQTLQLDSAESSSIESVQCCPDFVLPGPVADRSHYMHYDESLTKGACFWSGATL
jgi:hypothetical protein